MIRALALVACLGGCDRSPSVPSEPDDPKALAWCQRTIGPVGAPYFTALTLHARGGAFGQVDCQFLAPGVTPDDFLLRARPGAIVDVICSSGVTADPQMLESAATYGSAAQRSKSPGKLALRWPSQLKFWDGDADCVVDIVWHLPAAGLEPFATALETALTALTATTVGV